MAIEPTPLGFKKPDGNELVRGGDNVISDNAQKADDLITEVKADALTLASRLGVTEAKVDAGAGGPGLSADPDHPGLYYFAGPTIAPDPLVPGLFTF
ncbi:hypothetical protein PBI_JUDY_28 [Arthrobacter phage Judy]|uniref:Uncharacterized protein n=1 Tax=Arthrobacter phage Judy TaxID=2419958 RepID=A0A3G2KGK6_9CAUD|nr:hypothetical protein HOU50_gp28 [Arthrobacter phage Judy]AYN58098.1 hypothetical protein PBI_JUDY_28 [Arthrobacter phage Judy]